MLRFPRARWTIVLFGWLSMGLLSPLVHGEEAVSPPKEVPEAAKGDAKPPMQNIPWLDLRPGKGDGMTAEEETALRNEVARLESQARLVPGFKTWNAPSLWNANGKVIGKHRVIGHLETDLGNRPELKKKFENARYDDEFSRTLIVSGDDCELVDLKGAIIITSGSVIADSVSDCLVYAKGAITVVDGNRSLLCAECPIKVVKGKELILASSAVVRVVGGTGNIIVNTPPPTDEYDSLGNYRNRNMNPAASLHNNAKISLAPSRTIVYLPKDYRFGSTVDGKGVPLTHYRDPDRQRFHVVGDEITNPDGVVIPALVGWRIEWHPSVDSWWDFLILTKGDQSAILVY
ncbi:MAG: hypothetical protein R3C01_03925 [Planctomycetaceae bacterium]